MGNSPAIRSNDLVAKDTPGIGVAGRIACCRPLGFGMCIKGACEAWVELAYGETKVGRCTDAWKTILLAEQNQILRANQNLKSQIKKKK